MDKFITTDLGGLPLKLNDLRFQDQAYRLALNDILKSIIGDDSAVIYGCVITPSGSNTYSVDEGAIYFQNELWHVYQHTFAWQVGEIPQWHFITEFDAEGSKTFYNGQQFQTYQRRYAVVSVSTPANALDSISIYSLLGRISTLNRKELVVSPTLGFVGVPGNISRIRLVDRIATMHCAIRGGLTSIWQPAAQLNGTVPRWPVIVNAVAIDDNGDVFKCVAKIDTAGILYVRHFGGASIGPVDVYIHVSFETI